LLREENTKSQYEVAELKATLRSLITAKRVLYAANGIAFALVWERLGTGYAWVYNMTPDIAGIPVPILAAWVVFSALTATKRRSHLLIPLAFTIADAIASKLSLWVFNLSTLATIAFTAAGYYMIYFMLRAVNTKAASWKPPYSLLAPLLAAASAYIAYATLAAAYHKSISLSLLAEMASRLATPHAAGH